MDAVMNEPSATGDEKRRGSGSRRRSAVIAGVIYRYKWLIAGSVLVATALAATAAFFMTPVYRSSTVLAMAEPVEGGGALASLLDQAGGLANIAGLRVPIEGATDEALAMLRSRQFTEEFMRKHDVLPKIFGHEWESRVQPSTPEENAYWTAKAYGVFDERIRSAFEDRRTGLIIIQIDWRDRIEAATWANDLVRQLNGWMRQRAVFDADSLIAALEREVDRTDVVPVREAIYKLIEAQVKRRALASAREEYAFRVIDPAYAANLDQPLRPKPLLYLIAGPLLGLIGSVLLALTLESLRVQPEP